MVPESALHPATLSHILRDASLRAHGKADLIDRETRKDWETAASSGKATGEAPGVSGEQLIRLAGSSWRGRMIGEASLKTAGWLVSLEKPAAGGLTGMLLFFLMGVALVGSLFAVRAARDNHCVSAVVRAGSRREPSRSGPERSGPVAAASVRPSHAASSRALTSDEFDAPYVTSWAEGWALEDVLVPAPGSETIESSHKAPARPNEERLTTDLPEFLEISWAEPSASDSHPARESTQVSQRSTRLPGGFAGA